VGQTARSGNYVYHPRIIITATRKFLNQYFIIQSIFYNFNEPASCHCQLSSPITAAGLPYQTLHLHLHLPIRRPI